MEGISSQPDPQYRYGDFPELFWDAQPEAVIDVQNSVTLVRLLTRGRAEVIGRLLPLEVIRARLETLPLPEHVRIFWRAVLQSDPRVGRGAAQLREGT
jgi:hypothetical protein